VRMGVGLLAAFAIALAGCGDTGTEAGNSFESAFEQSFNKSFHESLVSSCTTSAKAGGVTEERATNLCNCASDKVRQRFIVQEKTNLKDEQLRPIIEECRAQIPG
jgi:hypothetical protein